MSDNRSSLMREVQIAHFSLIEANLYLDTHPYDSEALKALEYYSEKLACATKRYEEECAILTAGSADGVPFDWVKSPFPWEMDC